MEQSITRPASKSAARSTNAGYGFRSASLRFPKASAVEFFTPLNSDAPNSLGMALVLSSPTPLLLLDGDLAVKAASGSFCSAFDLDPSKVVGVAFQTLGAGEWGAR